MRALVTIVVILAVAGFFAWDRFRQVEGEPSVAAPAERVSEEPSPGVGRTSTPDEERESGPVVARLAPEDGAVLPRFDVVRVNSKGRAVIAGEAEPGASVTVTLGETVIGEVTADARGDWVLLPEAPLEPGTRELGLVQRTPGGAIVESESVVVIAVPERAEASRAGTTALAVLVPREGGGSRVLQARGVERGEELSLDTVDYDEEGSFTVGGRGGAGAEVRVYLDDRFTGRARVDPQGGWRVTPEDTVPEGRHTLRIEQVDPTGKVVSRLEAPFSRAVTSPSAGGETFFVVQPGHSLWHIARTTYGGGTQYVLIYEANSDRIRDPDLIYPGQILVLPKAN